MAVNRVESPQGTDQPPGKLRQLGRRVRDRIILHDISGQDGEPYGGDTKEQPYLDRTYYLFEDTSTPRMTPSSPYFQIRQSREGTPPQVLRRRKLFDLFGQKGFLVKGGEGVESITLPRDSYQHVIVDARGTTVADATVEGEGNILKVQAVTGTARARFNGKLLAETDIYKAVVVRGGEISAKRDITHPIVVFEPKYEKEADKGLITAGGTMGEIEEVQRERLLVGGR